MALLASASGEGHRTIAARLDRPPGRGPRLGARVRAGLGRLGCCGVRWSVSLADPPAHRPSGAPVVDALEALAWAARACVLRFGHQSLDVGVIVAVCGGGLLEGCPRDPPGY